MSKFIRVLCTVLILTFLLPGAICPMALADDLPEEGTDGYISYGDAAETYAKPAIDAQAALVMEAESGRVLYSKNADVKRSIASTTKIMTAIVALEYGDTEDVVTVSARAAGIGGSTIGLRAGDKYTLLELLYGMLMCSGNDAAIAIAEHIGGSVEGFAAMMNGKARELGAVNSVFVTPHGLDRDGQYSTAYDLALITRYALKNPVFASIVATKTSSIPGQPLYNTNEMLGTYPGADGVKTGYTGKAGRCLVTTAVRDGMRIISVVLGSPTRYKRAEASRLVLDYSFNNYSMHTLAVSGGGFKKVSVHRGISDVVHVRTLDTVRVPLTEDEAERVETRVFLPDVFEAPIYGGMDAGSVEYLVDGKVVGQSLLAVREDVRRKGFFDYLGDVFVTWGRMMKQGMWAG